MLETRKKKNLNSLQVYGALIKTGKREAIVWLQIQAAQKILKVDRLLVDELKSGFRPISVRDKATTIYSVPHQLYTVKPEFYRCRYMYFRLVGDFDKYYPVSRLKGLHMLSHMHSILSQNRNNTIEDYLSAMDKIKGRIR